MRNLLTKLPMDNLTVTRIKVVLNVQSPVLRRTSEFMSALDLTNGGDIVEKMPISFSTTTNIDNEYIEKLKKHLTGIYIGDCFVTRVESISVLS